MHAIVHPADIQDRDGGVLLLSTLFGLFPFLGKVFADGGYQGPRFAQGAAAYLAQMEVEIVKRSDVAQGFVVLPRRWVVDAPSPGSTAAAAWPRISRTAPGTPSHS